jgi:hypothetical protein
LEGGEGNSPTFDWGNRGTPQETSVRIANNLESCKFCYPFL